MIVIGLKQTEHVDWRGSLYTYFKSVYGSTLDLSSEVTALHNMRQDIVGVGKNTTGRDILYKYFGQLEMLDMRIPVNSNGVRIKFPWKNLYSGEIVAQNSSAFEKAAVLFNLGAVFSHIAVSSSDHKTEFSAFQSSAGVFSFISENFLHAPSIDFDADTVKCLSTLMLAQAQHSFFNKAIEGGTKSSLLFKLAQAAANMYDQAEQELVVLREASSWGDPDWVNHVAISSKYMSACAHHHYSIHLETQKKYGEAIAHLRRAKMLFGELKETEFDQEQASGLYDASSEQLRVLERENDLIYNATITPIVQEIPSKSVVTPTPLDALYPDSAAAGRVVGKELFSSVIPLDVHEKASLYSEEKTQLMRQQREAVEIADQELRSALEYMDLPRSASALRHPDEKNDPTLSGVPDMIKDWSDEISATSLNLDFTARRQQILATIDRAPPSAENQGQIQKVKQYLITGAQSDAKIQEGLDSIRTDHEILRAGPSGPLAQLFRFDSSTNNGISLLDMDETVQAKLNEQLESVLELVSKLRKIEKERRVVFTELKERLHKDDISSVLVANRKNPNLETSVFPTELAKFQPYTSRIESSNRHQRSLLAEVSTTWKAILSSSEVKRRASDRDNALSQRSVLIDRFRAAYETWLGVKTSIAEARKFYDEVDELAQSLVSQPHIQAPLVSPLANLSLGYQQDGHRMPGAFPNPHQSQQTHSQNQSTALGSQYGFDYSSGGPPVPRDTRGLDTSAYAVPSAYDPSLYEPQWGERGRQGQAPPQRPAKPF